MENMKLKVLSTTNYNMFKLLAGNRGVDPVRVNKIRKSIETVGWVHNPIIVNENYEVIDGQGRLAALKELGMPVEYLVAPGTGVKECRSMNLNQKNWTIGDWISSYAELGSQDYKYLDTLYKKYRHINLTAITCAVRCEAKVNAKEIKEGLYKCSEEQYESACEVLDYLDSIMPYLLPIKGRVELLMVAIIYIYMYVDTVDIDRLTRVIKERHLMIPPTATLESALLALESIYNRNNRGVLCNFANDYKAFARASGKRDAEHMWKLKRANRHIAKGQR